MVVTNRSVIGGIGLACFTLFSSSLSFAIDVEHYNGSPKSALMELPNGALAPVEAIRSMAANLPTEGKVVQIDRNVYQLSGYKFYSPTVIELDRGLIVVDSGESVEEGREFRELIREKISEKPVLAVMFTHSHYAKGTIGLIDGDPDVKIIGHHRMNSIMEAKGDGLGAVTIPELQPLADGRAEIQFNRYMPESGPDSAYSMTINLNEESGWLPVTTPVRDGDELEIGGETFRFLTEYTDSPDTLTIWWPSRKLVVSNNVLWATMPNFYTLRGDRYRDPRLWQSAVRRMRDLQPEKVISLHFRPVLGNQEVLKILNTYLDGISFLYDQTIRQANLGVKPDQLAHAIQLPESIAESGFFSELYGQSEHFPQQIYQHAVGWFSGYGEDLHTMPKVDEAKNIVELSGGIDAVEDAYEKAMKEKKYLWASKLANYLRLVEPDNPAHRSSLASAFREMGRLSYGTIARAFYVTSAKALESENGIPLIKYPSRQRVAESPEKHIDYFRTRVNPEQAIDKEGVLWFSIDGADPVGLHLRNSVAEFLAAPASHYANADVKLSCASSDWADFYLSNMDADTFVRRCSITQGSSETAKNLLSSFDPAIQAVMYE